MGHVPLADRRWIASLDLAARMRAAWRCPIFGRYAHPDSETESPRLPGCIETVRCRTRRGLAAGVI